ncbi:MAG: hypothetical protein ACTSRZ_14290 [Promethearchaeota archaeon]
MDNQLLDLTKIYIKFQDIEANLYDLEPLHGFIINADDDVELIYKDNEYKKPSKHLVEYQ